MSADEEILERGETCVAVAKADQGGFVLCGADYFRAVREAVLAAERSVWILGLLALAVLIQRGAGRFADKETAVAYFETIRESPWSPLVLLLVFVIASITGVSLNVLLVAAALVLNPWITFAAGLAGAQIGANVAFSRGNGGGGN